MGSACCDWQLKGYQYFQQPSLPPPPACSLHFCSSPPVWHIAAVPGGTPHSPSAQTSLADSLKSVVHPQQQLSVDHVTKCEGVTLRSCAPTSDFFLQPATTLKAISALLNNWFFWVTFTFLKDDLRRIKCYIIRANLKMTFWNDG